MIVDPHQESKSGLLSKETNLRRMRGQRGCGPSALIMAATTVSQLMQRLKKSVISTIVPIRLIATLTFYLWVSEMSILFSDLVS
jgi:hypothetical protein